MIKVDPDAEEAEAAGGKPAAAPLCSGPAAAPKALGLPMLPSGGIAAMSDAGALATYHCVRGGNSATQGRACQRGAWRTSQFVHNLQQLRGEAHALPWIHACPTMLAPSVSIGVLHPTSCAQNGVDTLSTWDRKWFLCAACAVRGQLHLGITLGRVVAQDQVGFWSAVGACGGCSEGGILVQDQVGFCVSRDSSTWGLFLGGVLVRDQVEFRVVSEECNGDCSGRGVLVQDQVELKK
jgi:hypothetical protein